MTCLTERLQSVCAAPQCVVHCKSAAQRRAQQSGLYGLVSGVAPKLSQPHPVQPLNLSQLLSGPEFACLRTSRFAV